MALSSSLFTTVSFKLQPSPRSEGLSSVRFGPTHLNFPLRLGFSTVALARRRSAESGAADRKKKPQPPPIDIDEEDELDDAAFEALLKELEKDLKNDPSFMNDNDSEITEEDFAMVERVLAETLRGSGSYDIDLSSLSVEDVESDEDDTKTDDAETDDNDAETDDVDDDDDAETDDGDDEEEEEEED